MTTPIETSAETAPERVDDASRLWLRRLAGTGPGRDAAVAELHALLLKAARFEVERRRASLPHLRGGDYEDLAQQSADDALLALLGKLDRFRGEARFTTWAYKFALLEAGVKMRRRAWQEREVPLAQEAWSLLADAGGSAGRGAEHAPRSNTIAQRMARWYVPPGCASNAACASRSSAGT